MHFFNTAAAAPVALVSLAMKMAADGESSIPVGYPASSALIPREKHLAAFTGFTESLGEVHWEGIRVIQGIAGCVAVAIWTCREIDRQFNPYIETLLQKPLFLTGPLLQRNRAPVLSLLQTEDAFRNNNNNNNGSSPCPSSASSAGNCSSSTAMAATTEEEEERKMQLKSRQ
ncbi:UDP-glycosyltransferase 79B6 [Linum perenne]